MHPILFKLGPVTIYTYGVFVFLGVVAGYFVAAREAQKQGINKNIFSNIAFWLIISAFLGAKILYILVEFQYFLKAPLTMIRTGFVFYGGIISAIACLYFLTKKYKINFLQFADCVALGIPLGHAFGRLGCFFYGCCYGKAYELGICLLFPPSSPAGFGGLKVLPTQLISSLVLLLIFFGLFFFIKFKKFDGQIFFSYLIFYGLFRFVMEFFRGDPRGYILFLSTSQFISLILIAAGIFMLYRQRSSS